MQVEILPHASVTVHVIVDTPVLNNPLALVPEPLRVVTPVTLYVIVGVPVQLSVATNTGIVCMLPVTWQNVCAAGQVSAGAVLSTILVVAGDSLQAVTVLAVPAGMDPQAALVTYLVLIKYPLQLSAVGGVFVPHDPPSSKLYSIVKPATAAGGVTVIAPHPAFTTGAVGAVGKITTLTVLLDSHATGPAVPAIMLPHAAVKTYLACTV